MCQKRKQMQKGEKLEKLDFLLVIVILENKFSQFRENEHTYKLGLFRSASCDLYPP